MKKLVSLALFALSAFALLGASLQTYHDPKSGDAISSRYSGRLASVDVFSTEAAGTVEICRVFEAPFYTNAYDIVTWSETNIVETVHSNTSWVVDGRFSEGHEETFTLTQKVDSVESVVTWGGVGYGAEYSLSYSKGLGCYSLLSGGITDTKSVPFGTDRLEMRLAFSGGHDDFTLTNTGWTVSSTYSTNIVERVVTNSVTKVLAYDLVVTNAVLNGTCEGNCYHGTPSPDVWVFPGDKLIFTGTATGGDLRIVIE